MNTLELANFGPVIPVIVINKLEDAVPMAKALVDGGIRVLEITLRTPIALQCMEAIAKAVPEAIIGAGTVRSVADARAAKMQAVSLPSAPAIPAIWAKPVWRWVCLYCQGFQLAVRLCRLTPMAISF